jgi:hypothetical protein
MRQSTVPANAPREGLGGGGGSARWSRSPARMRDALFAVPGVLLVGSVAFVAAAHVADRYALGWVQGTRMALARYVNEGLLYPPLFAHGRFGGTRFMPVPTVLHAGAARITDEYVVSGKLVGAASTVLLLTGLYVLLRRLGCGRPESLLLTAAVLATVPGLYVATSIQGDSLAVFLQLAAVGVIARRIERKTVVASAILCVLAVAGKLSAVWAPLAILIWLLIRHRREALWFIGAFVGLLAGGGISMQVLTHGEFFANLTEVTFSGVGGMDSWLRAPAQALSLIESAGPVLVALLVISVVRIVLDVRRGISLYSLSLIVAVVVLIGTAADEGALANHVIDVAVLSSLVAGEFLANPRVRASMFAQVVTGAVVMAMCSVFFIWRIQPAIASAIDSARGAPQPRYSTTPLAGTVGPGDRILSEDPFIPVSEDRLPVVLDAWVVLRMEGRHPTWIADLAARIDRLEFDTIILVQPLDNRGWYATSHFGNTLADAMRRSYRLSEVRAGYYLYLPKA